MNVHDLGRRKQILPHMKEQEYLFLCKGEWAGISRTHSNLPSMDFLAGTEVMVG